jgi:hypothetical protein
MSPSYLTKEKMRRKALQDLANVFCQMFVGWRMGNDVSLLIGAGSCSITIDVLAGTAFIDKKPARLYIAEELSAWFMSRLQELNIPSVGIVSANLHVNQTLRLEETKSKKVAHFGFRCQSKIETDERSYQGCLAESHSWHEPKSHR